MKQNKIVIIGSGGFAKSVLDVVLFNETNMDVVFVDKNAKQDKTILGYPVLTTFNITDEKIFVALEDSQKRKEEATKQKNLVSIISKRAYLGKNVTIGKGVFVAHDVHIGILSEIGDYSFLNTNSSIGTECVIGEASTIAANAILCNNVKIGENVSIGARAVIVDEVNIDKNVTVKHGAVVTENIDNSKIYAEI